MMSNDSDLVRWASEMNLAVADSGSLGRDGGVRFSTLSGYACLYGDRRLAPIVNPEWARFNMSDQ